MPAGLVRVLSQA